MKRLFILLIVALIVIQTTSAVELQLKDNFKQEETLIAKLSGNFEDPVQEENIYFYQGHVRIAVDLNIEKINDDYYIYAPLKKLPGNYSLVIKNVEYSKGSQITDEGIKKDFVITNETADFSINKGVIQTNTDFSIKVQNLKESKITLTSKFNEQERSIILKSGEIKDLSFEISGINKSSLEALELSSENLIYQLPVYVIANETTKNKIITFKFDPAELNASISTNKGVVLVTYIYNNGEETAENISLSVSNSLKDFVNLSVNKINELEPDSSVKIEIFVLPVNQEGFLTGKLKASSKDFYNDADVYLNFVSGYIPKEGEYGENTTAPGTLVNITDDNGDLIDDNNGSSTSSTGKTIGWVIVVIVAVFVIWFFFKKYRGAKGGLTALDRAKR